MFLARSLRLRPRIPSNRRFFIAQLNEGFLDLALALPYPPTWPAYSATIILVTIAARTAILPTVFWASSRKLRYESKVVPVLRELKPIVMHEQAIAMRNEGLLDNKETRATIHAERCHKIMKACQKDLAKMHKCNTTLTAFIPVIPQIPVFFLLTAMFARLCADPTSPFDSESFLTLTTLNHPDPTFTLPVVLGLVTMANVESNTWFMSGAEKEAAKESDKKMEEMVAKSGDRKSKIVFNLRKNMKDSMRILSVLRIGLAAIAPGAVTLYWVTSAIFGIGQTWLVNSLELRHRRTLSALSASKPASISLAELQAMARVGALTHYIPSSAHPTTLSAISSTLASTPPAPVSSASAQSNSAYVQTLQNVGTKSKKSKKSKEQGKKQV